ncbi:hypothetical protein OLMES_1047 [Oleiphilus messinensis]|uniref:Phospholipid/glycerol acyltransferase domain-containing protein n=1 Tax=Oleiphilus messinensis TaxID=141451 RepID=A0A1Y0I6V7_9GAMM|nr:1-acyl-sn-glycerol-3-phosphate acyltransferase [Oleiphilus messinensis]ARU55133.1 hypothetical protein OLMES_1047 [Oleiphilus messinensis]
MFKRKNTIATGSVYRKMVSMCSPVVRKYSRLNIVGLEQVPAHSGALLACNHSGGLWWDALCLLSSLPERQIHFIAHHWDAKVPLMKQALDLLDCQFMEANVMAITAADNICIGLKQGQLHCIYPEESYHTFRDRYTLFKFSGHGVRYAELANVPIIPCAVIGAEEAAPILFGPKLPNVPLHIPLHLPLILPFKVTVVFGQPVSAQQLLEDHGDYSVAAHTLREHVFDLITPYRSCKKDRAAYIRKSSLL